MSNTPQISTDVDAVFQTYPADARAAMMSLRALIFQVAAGNPAVGPLSETLKWGEPSYLTEKTKSGSTIRIAWNRANPDRAALYFNCKTTLVARIQEIYPDVFSYQGNRAIAYPVNGPMPREALAHCIEMTLLYHKNKRMQPT